MENRLGVVTIGVKGLSWPRSFHQALVRRESVQPDGEVCFFQAGGMVFGLWTALGGHGAPRVEFAYNVSAPDEVNAILAETASAGGAVIRSAAQADWGRTSGAFADPDGHVWEVTPALQAGA